MVRVLVVIPLITTQQTQSTRPTGHTYLYPNYEWGHHDLSVLGSNPLCTLAFDRCFMRKHTLFSLSLCRVPLLPRMT